MHGKEINPLSGAPRKENTATAARKKRNEMAAKEEDNKDGDDASEEIDDDDDGGAGVQQTSLEIDRGVATKQEWIPCWLAKQEREYDEMVKWNVADDVVGGAINAAGFAGVEGAAEGHGSGSGSGQQRAPLLPPRGERRSASGRLPPRDKKKSAGTQGDASKEAEE